MSIFVKDPCGFICITLTYVAVFYADYVVIRWVIMQTMQDSLWAPFHVVLFNTVILMLSLSHLRAMCSDPGAVPLPQNRMDFSDIHSEGEISKSLVYYIKEPMKVPSKQVELRPGLHKIIPRLPSMVKKNVLSPIGDMIRGIKNTITNKPSFVSFLQDWKSNTNRNEGECCDETSKADTSLPTTSIINIDDGGDAMEIRNSCFNLNIENEIVTVGKTKVPKICGTCDEDRLAYQTCNLCRDLHSSLPTTSCAKCLKHKPSVKLCLRYHEKQAVIYLPESKIDRNWSDVFNQRNPALAKNCSGKRPSINSCPMCLSIWPKAGECHCRMCQDFQPIVKYYRSKTHQNPRMYLCPCSKCSYLRPKTKICELCRSMRVDERKNDCSYFVVLP